MLTVFDLRLFVHDLKLTDADGASGARTPWHADAVWREPGRDPGQLRRCELQRGRPAEPLRDRVTADEDLAITLASLRTRPPRWVDETALPPLYFRSGQVLSDAARRGFIADLKSEGTSGTARHARAARAVLRDADCSALMTALLSDWAGAGQPQPARRWLLFAIGILGDADYIDRLGNRVFDENRAKKHQMAGHCVASLARSPHPAAVGWLARLSRTAPTARLRSAAWSARQARPGGDPVMVRSRGFDHHGQRAFDLAGRPLLLRLQADGAVHIFEGSRRLKSLPRARKRDDPGAVTTARARFAALKSALHADLTDTAAALIEAMITGQPITGWRALLDAPVPHWIVRGLIWEALPEEGEHFRFLLTDEGDAVDVDGVDLSLDVVTAVRPIHPLHLAKTEADAWRILLLDAAINSPFPQLDRPIYHPRDPDQPFGSLLANRPAVNPWQLARTLSSRGYLADRGYRIDHCVKTIGPYRITIQHEPYSPFERSASRTRIQQVTLRHGQTLLPRPPAVLYSEIAADLAGLLT